MNDTLYIEQTGEGSPLVLLHGWAMHGGVFAALRERLESQRTLYLAHRSVSEMGGQLQGRVRDGRAPAGIEPSFEWHSPPLAEVVRDINKFSNNVMARQLFLSIGAEGSKQPASMERAQRSVGDWMVSRGLDRREFVLENGAGLSRIERLTSAGLARLLVAAFESPLMPELMSSLPIVGVDGTMRKRSGAAGSAHIKTGLLADTRAIAGYVLAASGKRYAIVAFVNHPNAGATQGALDALLNWVYSQG